MSDMWVPDPGDRVKLNADARGRNFESKADGRRRWTVARVEYTPGFRQPDVHMTDGDCWNVCWLAPAGVKEEPE